MSVLVEPINEMLEQLLEKLIGSVETYFYNLLKFVLAIFGLAIFVLAMFLFVLKCPQRKIANKQTQKIGKVEINNLSTIHKYKRGHRKRRNF